jgi:putative lipoprotein
MEPEALLASVRGRLMRGPGVEGGEVPLLVVNSFEVLRPGEGCGGGAVDRAIEGTEWVLSELPGVPRLPLDSRASLMLDPGTRRVTGSTGCNRYAGTYALDGGSLRLSVGALTRMACADALNEVERAWLDALRLTGSWRLSGSTLNLLGEAGTVARLEAGPGAAGRDDAPGV